MADRDRESDADTIWVKTMPSICRSTTTTTRRGPQTCYSAACDTNDEDKYLGDTAKEAIERGNHPGSVWEGERRARGYTNDLYFNSPPQQNREWGKSCWEVPRQHSSITQRSGTAQQPSTQQGPFSHETQTAGQSHANQTRESQGTAGEQDLVEELGKMTLGG